MSTAAAARSAELASDIVDAFIDRAPRTALLMACKTVEARTTRGSPRLAFDAKTAGELRDYLTKARLWHADDVETVITVTANGLDLGGPPAAAAAPEAASAAPAEANAARQPEHRRPGGIVGLTHAEIVPNPNNPRKHFDAQDIEDLATSVVVDGQGQNLIVRELGADEARLSGAPYMLIAGERRWRAIGRAIARGEWAPDRAIPALIKKVGEEQGDVLALIENLSRVDLRPLEEAEAFHQLRLRHRMGTEEIARRVHKTQRFVQQRLQLLDLSPQQRAQLDALEITVEQARRLIARQNAEDPKPRPRAAAPDARAAAAEPQLPLPAPPAPKLVVLKPTIAIGPTSLRYDGAIEILRAAAEEPALSIPLARKTGLGLTAVRRRVHGLAADGLVIDGPDGVRPTAAGRAQLAAIDAAIAAARAPADPAGARAAARAAVEERLSQARTVLAPHDSVTEMRQLALAYDALWKPAAAAPFLELVLEALRA